MHTLREIWHTRHDQAGISLIDVIIAMFLLSIVISGLTAALSTAILTSAQANQQVAALELAISQIEKIKDADYAPVTTQQINIYPSVNIPPELPGITITIITEPIEGGDTLQKNTVKIYRNGALIVSIEDYKGSLQGSQQ
ncbi:MAG: hypothetical protein EXR62_14045 [Chloroflexi bacterium]|nr:hypothetical protein [Chloroflexota bacterium]